MLWLEKIREYCRCSLWLTPAIMGAISIAIAISLCYIEEVYNPFACLGIKWLEAVNIEKLANTISTLLGAIIMVVGILLPMMFSILMRSSSQFTPMILRVYRVALAPKIFLGLAIATTLYLMTLLIALNQFASPFILRLSVVIGFLLILLTIYSIPAFFHKFAKILEPTYLAPVIVEDIKKDLDKHCNEIKRLPFTKLEGRQDRQNLNPKKYQYCINSPKSGYLQSIHYNLITTYLKEIDGLGAIPVRNGAFVLKGVPIIFFNAREEPSQELITLIKQAFSLGKKRSGLSDIELRTEELNSIILSTLSSGADLSTACECISHLGFVSSLLLHHSFNSGIYYDPNNAIRIYSKQIDFYGFIHSIFDPIRQNSKNQPMIILHILKILKQLILNCVSKNRVSILFDITTELYEQSKGVHYFSDQEKINQLYLEIETIINEKYD